MEGQLGVPGEDPNLVLLVDLSSGPVELQAVSILGDMAPGDHDRGQAETHTMVSKHRSGKSATFERNETGLLNGRAAQLRNVRTAVSGVLILPAHTPGPQQPNRLP